jgi:hypothetical protein
LESRSARAAEKLDVVHKLRPGHSAEDVVEALIRAAGQIEIAETRVW